MTRRVLVVHGMVFCVQSRNHFLFRRFLWEIAATARDMVFYLPSFASDGISWFGFSTPLLIVGMGLNIQAYTAMALKIITSFSRCITKPLSSDVLVVPLVAG